MLGSGGDPSIEQAGVSALARLNLFNELARPRYRSRLNPDSRLQQSFVFGLSGVGREREHNSSIAPRPFLQQYRVCLDQVVEHLGSGVF